MKLFEINLDDEIIRRMSDGYEEAEIESIDPNLIKCKVLTVHGWETMGFDRQTGIHARGLHNGYLEVIK